MLACTLQRPTGIGQLAACTSAACNNASNLCAAVLQGLMRTPAGRRLAEERHAVMEQFLQRFHAEWRGEA